MTQKTRPLSHRIQKRTGHRRTLAEKHYENFSHKILDSRVPLCYAISEGRPRLCNMSSEAGALPSELRIENDSDRKFSKSTFFKVFLETTFHATPIHVSCYPDHYEPKIFFSVFWSPYLHSEGCGCDRLELRIENNSDGTFSKSKIFKLILETTFVHLSCYPNHHEQKIFFRFSKSGLEGSP